MPSLRIISVDARSYARDRAGLAAAIGAADPHVAVVHGSPHLGRWRALSAMIARNAGLVVVGGGRVGGANLVLSSLGVDFVSVSDTLYTHNPFAPAGATVARLRHHGVGFAVAAASLGSANPGTDAASVRRAVGAAADVAYVLSVADNADAFADLGSVIADRLVCSPELEVKASERRAAGVVFAEVALNEA